MDSDLVAKSQVERMERSDLIAKQPKVILDDDMTFPKATVDPRLLKLQGDVTEFVTSVILKHETEFYSLVEKCFPDRIEDILGTTNASIILMITETTNKFYNDIYSDIQNKRDKLIAKLVLEMTSYSDYGPHILLDKLLRLTIEAHLEVNREQLVFIKDNVSDQPMKPVENFFDFIERKLTDGPLSGAATVSAGAKIAQPNNCGNNLYEKSVLDQINIYLLSCNLLHVLSKGLDEDTDFVDIPQGEKAFNIVIDKNIEN